MAIHRLRFRWPAALLVMVITVFLNACSDSPAPTPILTNGANGYPNKSRDSDPGTNGHSDARANGYPDKSRDSDPGTNGHSDAGHG